jgi:hypothetical protein
MSHAINLPDDLFEQIEEIARQQGSKPEAIAQQWLRAAILRSNEAPRDHEYDPSRDPLMRLAGSISSGDPSWGERHDEYLAQAYQVSHEPE